MSATIEVPRGLDSLTPDEQRLMDSMRDETPAPEETPPAATPSAPPPPAETTDDFEIEVPEAPEAAPAPAEARQATVPQQALHAERERRKAEEKARKELEKKLADTEAERAKDAAVLQARLDMIAAAMKTEPVAPPAAPAPVVEEPLPDKNTDPLGYFEALNARLQKTIENQGAMLQGLTEQQRQTQAAADLRNWGVAQEQAFEATEPSYREAMAWLQKSRHDELIAIGIADAAERQRIINGDVTSIAVNARNSGANFAERLYKAAQTRGWQKKAPEVPAPPSVTTEPPAIPPLEVAAPPAPDPEARAARIAAGRENSTTIGSLGAAPPARLSVEKIANMSEADFAKFIQRFEGNPNALRDLMGH